MAWSIHYQVYFASRDGKRYQVDILEQDYSGSIVFLTGGPEPFVTNEEDGDDMFTAIRSQTGYLRVIDETGDGSLLESLIPANNTEKMVRLVEGGSVRWQGFLVAQAYSQPWDRHAKLLEFPVKSFLAALEDVQYSTDDAGRVSRLAYFFYSAFTPLVREGGGVTPWDTVYVATDMGSSPVSWLSLRSLGTPFFDEVTTADEGTEVKTVSSKSCKDVLEAILTLFGLTMREDGRRLYICQYDTIGYAVRGVSMTWSQLSALATSSSVPSLTVIDSGIASAGLLSSLDFRDNDNTAAFVQGYRAVQIELDLSDSFRLEMSDSPEDDSTPLEYKESDYHGANGTWQYNGKVVYVQPHAPVTGQLETYYFRQYTRSDHNSFENAGLSTYSACLAQTPMVNPSYDGRNMAGRDSQSSSENFVTGAFPCRWFHDTRERGLSHRLSSALFLQIQYAPTENGDDFAAKFPIAITYAISSAYSLDMSHASYIRMDFANHWFHTAASTDRGTWTTGTDSYTESYMFDRVSEDGSSESAKSSLYCYLRIGDKEWNGTEWVSATGSTFFKIDFKGSRIDTNITEDMDLEASTGWVVPLASGMNGIITFGFANMAQYNYFFYGDEAAWDWSHGHIITDFSVTLVSETSLVASDRTTNVYRREISSSGFTGETTTDLAIGTFNNNVYSPVFIRDDDNDFIEEIGYGTTPVNERPEIHLLSRMALQFGSMRRTYSATVHTGNDLFATRYTYLSRNFAAFVSERNWREDTESLKFIEIK